MTRELRRLGDSNITTPPLILGGNVFGWTADETTSFAILDRFIAAGFCVIDTANVYSTWVSGHQGGESETIIGNWMKSRGNRDQVVIATKVGHEMDPDRKGLKADNILREVEASLQRLQTEYIDLYQSHTDDLATPVAETLEAYHRLLDAGKVRAIGASNFTADRLQESLQTARQAGLPLYQSLQPEYNLCERQKFETTLEPLCLREHLGVIPYFGLARGFLTGKYRSAADLDRSPRGKGVARYLDQRGLRILTALDQVASELQSKLASVALAWLMARPSVTAPISSATSIEQLEDLIAAADLKLTTDQLARLTAASAYTAS
ncbi:MAG: aldo/keto reductase [candidate division Zixibacteria bacterium]|nr:aldo/keto reductase [candidate division Zixibacteria bacterium]